MQKSCGTAVTRTGYSLQMEHRVVHVACQSSGIPSKSSYREKCSASGRWDNLMTKLHLCEGIVLGLAGAFCAVNAWAADLTPVKAPPAAAASTPKPCTGGWGFISTDCQLTWQGITVYGAIDAGFGWQSHGAPWGPRSAGGVSYLIQKQNNPAVL